MDTKPNPTQDPRGARQDGASDTMKLRQRVDGHQRTLADHSERLRNIEQSNLDLSELVEIAKRVKRYVKLGFPILVTAALSSGIVSGKWGAFLHALIQ
jgi:hypothetical protein